MIKVIVLIAILLNLVSCVRTKSLETYLNQNSQADRIIDHINIETSNDGTGSIITTANLINLQTLDLYAVGRDMNNNFISAVNATWTVSNSSLGAVAPQISSFATFTPSQAGSTTVSANYNSLATATSHISIRFIPQVQDQTLSSAPLQNRTINLNYYYPTASIANACAISNLQNATIVSACTCLSGNCSVQISPSAIGEVSFKYNVTVAGEASQDASIGFSVVPQISIANITIDPWGVATLTATLDHASSQTVSFKYSTQILTSNAIPWIDYIPEVSTLVTIPAGQTSAHVNVVLIYNSIQNNTITKNFHVALSDSINGIIAVNSAQVTLNSSIPYMNNIKKILAGDQFSCALSFAGQVRCWGRNDQLQIGNGSAASDVAYPTQVIGLSSGVTDLGVGYENACALLSDKTVKCWGGNGAGELGDNTTTDRSSPVSVIGVSNVAKLFTGLSGSCVILEDQSVKCWGYNAYGQLGDGATTNRLTAVPIAALSSNVDQIVLGGTTGCGLFKDGSVKCWGYNLEGQLGDGTTTNKLTPTQVLGLTTGVTQISYGNKHFCALLSSGQVKCWGNNAVGQLGDGTYTNRSTPITPINQDSNVTSISSSASRATCSIKTGGEVYCWGENGITYFLTIDESSWDEYLPTPIQINNLPSDIINISLGYDHVVALRSNYTGLSWGRNTYKQCSPVSVPQKPFDISSLQTNITAVSSGRNHFCALNSSGQVKCWGENLYGELGNGTTSNSKIPVSVTGLAANAIKVSAAGSSISGGFSCALLANGEVACWGLNDLGQLGNGTTTNSSTPVNVVGLNASISDIQSGGGSHTCVLTTSGGVKCWGESVLTPTDIVGLTSDVSKISVGLSSNCAQLTNGNVKCWGTNTNGELGDGTTTASSTPVDVQGLGLPAIDVAVGGYAFFGSYIHACALLNNHHVKCWGNNNWGQLGNGTIISSLTPVEVSGITNAIAIQAGTGHSCALLSTGTVKCWGNYGFLGANQLTDSNIPVQISGISNGVTYLNKGQSPCIIMYNNSLKCWGSYLHQVESSTEPYYMNPF